MVPGAAGHLALEWLWAEADPEVRHENAPCALGFRTAGADGRRCRCGGLPCGLRSRRLPRPGGGHRAVAWLRYRKPDRGADPRSEPRMVGPRIRPRSARGDRRSWISRL